MSYFPHFLAPLKLLVFTPIRVTQFVSSLFYLFRHAYAGKKTFGINNNNGQKAPKIHGQHKVAGL